MSKRSKSELLHEVFETLRAFQTGQELFDELAAERLGVNRTDLRVMDVLSQRGPLTAGALAEGSGLSRPALTAAIDRIAALGYVRRVRSDADRREVRIELTERLYSAAAEIWGPNAAEAPAAFDAFTKAELEAVLRFLEGARAFSERQRARLQRLLRGK